MESVYAALLLHKADKDIDEATIEKVLKAAGVKVDKNQIKYLLDLRIFSGDCFAFVKTKTYGSPES